MARRILAVGDCNTKGAGDLKYQSYPERISESLGIAVDNHGYTMSTTREGLNLLRNHLMDCHEWVIIQFGLVDSYATFTYSPYILYYPDNPIRKQLRAVVKKYKKVCRNSGLNRKLGESPVVSQKEYERNISTMIEMCGNRKIFLPETIPHHDNKRNDAICRYNKMLREISRRYDNCALVETYDLFADHLASYYSDRTHANAQGYAAIAAKILGIIGAQETTADLPVQGG